MKQFKLTFVLTVLMSMVGLQAFAAWDTSTKVQVDGLYYYLDKDNYLAQVTSMSSGKYVGNITIPSTFNYQGNTYSVTSIGGSAFRYCSGLTSVTIPNSVTTIGSSAFGHCSGLTSIDIPNSVTSIGEDAFSGTTWYDNQPDGMIYVGKTFYKYKGTMPENTTISIKEGTLGIAGSAFYECSNLTSVEIPNSVTSIGNSAFYGCSGLTSVTIPNSVTSIEAWAFQNCTGITSIEIPNSVTSIGYSAFSGCSKLTSVTIPNSVTTIGSSAFGHCSGLTSIDIPNSVTSIGNQAFYRCSGLTSVHITDITSWCNISFSDANSNPLYYAKHLFMNGKEITDLVIPDGVTSIGLGAFDGCSGLTSVTIPNSVTLIGDMAFCNCSGLTSVTIGNSVTTIGDQAFRGCSKLVSVTIPNSVTSIGVWAFHNCSGLTSVTIPNSVTSIGVGAFYFCSSLTSVTIGNSVTTIGYEAFSGCSKLASVTIPNSVTSIGDRAFYDCYFEIQNFINNSSLDAEANNYWRATIVDSRENGFAIKDGVLLKYDGSETSVTIPNSVTSIGERAFEDCSGLTSVTIPNSVTSIGDRAFYECSNLTSVTSEAENVPSTGHSAFPYLAQRNGTLYVPINSINTYGTTEPWRDFRTIKAIRIKYDSIYYAFSKTTKQATVVSGDEKYTGSVIIPETVTYDGVTYSVTSIGESAFYDCSGLTSVTIPNSVTSIGDYAFRWCRALTEVYCNAENVPNTGATVFDENKATLYLPTTSVAAYMAVDPWSKFGTVKTQDGSEIYYGSCGNNVRYYLDSGTGVFSITGTGAMTNYSSSSNAPWYNKKSYIKTVKIADDVTSIGNYAFYKCDSLESVTIPNSVTSIGSDAFSSCSKLTSVDIKDIDAWCNIKFNNNYSNPLSYAHHLFMEGKEITDLVIPDSVTSIGNYTFDNCRGLISVTIPNSVTSIGSYAFYNCSSLTSVTIPNSVTSIGSYAFSWCSGLTEVYCYAENVPTTSTVAFYNASISNATLYLPAASVAAYMAVDPWSNFGTVKTQGGSTIYNGSCGTNVRYSLDTSTGVLSITGTGSMTNYSSSSNAPWYNKKSYIKTVEITNGVTSIGNYAFYNCDSLESVTIPNSVTSIGDRAFSVCSYLTSIVVERGNTKYDSRDNCNAIIETATNTLIAGCKNTIIPNSVTSVGSYAFESCSGLTSVTIPNSVTEIGGYAFDGCSGLTKITLNSNAIASKTYSSSFAIGNIFGSQVKEYFIGESVTSIGENAFSGCSDLISITIPYNVTSIGESAFSGCSKLTEVYCNAENVPTTSTDAFYNINIANATLYVPATSVAAYKSATPWNEFGSIADNGVYYGSCGENVNYYHNTRTDVLKITGIGAMTDYSNTGDAPWYAQRANIKSVEIADGVTSIGERTFCNCSAITSISISNSVKSINSYAFSDCPGLTSITIPNGVTSIGLNAFDFNLTSIVVASGNAKFDSRDNCNAVIETATNTLIMTCKNTVIPNSVSCIGDYAFYRCPDFSSVTIPNSVTSIGDYAFYDCNSLVSIIIPNSVTSIGGSAFYGTAWYNNQPDGLVYAGKVAYKYKGTMPENTSIIIEEGTLGITGSAFSGCSGLTSVTIPSSVISIGDDAFSGSSSLIKVTLNSNAITSKTYSSSSTIGNIFGSQVKEYVLGDNVKSIGSYAFYNCKSLTSVTIPNSVTKISGSAFNNCSGLTSITIPNSVTEIGQDAFSSCSKLTEVYCNAENVPTTSTDAFNNANISNATLYVPAASVAAYMAVDPWSKFGTVKTQGGSEIYNGSCGDNVRYSLDTGTGVLSITGTGTMTNYSSSSNVPWYNKKSYIKTVEITNGITSIGNYALYNCDSLESVTIPNSVTSIGSYAFYVCSGLTSIEIPNSVTSIGNNAFYKCYFEKRDFINNSRLDAEYNNYWGAIIVDSRDNGFVIKDGVLLKYSGNESSVTIPNSVTSIGAEAFSGCSSLTSVTFPNSVTSIGNDAFRGCSKLASVTIPTSVTSIGYGAFYGTAWYDNQPDGLVYAGKVAYEYKGTMPENTTISIEEGTLGIAGSAFYECSNLTSVEIPNSVTTIGNGAFYNCRGLTSVTIGNSVTSIESGAFLYCSGLKKVTLNSNAIVNTSLCSIFGSQVKEYILGEDVTSIGNYAFKDCSSLTSAIIPNSVTSIGSFAFRDCSHLKEIYCYAENVPTTSTNAFYNASISSATLYLPAASVTAYMVVEPWSIFGTVKTQDGSIIYHGSCGENAWYSLNTGTGVFSITGTGAMTNYSSSSNVPWYNKKSYIKTVEMSDDITSIGDYAFYNCDSLESFTIPNSVTSIGGSAFYNCSGLTSIEIPNNVTSIGSSAFFGCAGELIVNCKIPSASQSTNGAFYGSKFKSVTIGEDITSIGDYAFYDCDSLVSVTVPNSVTSIGSFAFSSCEVLTQVSINSNTIVSTGDYSLCSIFGSQVKEYIIGKNVTSIWAGKFSDCTDLAYITIPTSVKSIGNSAFRNCPKLESVAIPNSVTSIGEYALSDCANLKSVTIGSGVQVIGKDVFENHHPSKVFWLTNTPPEGYAYAEGSINYVSNTRYTEFSNVIRYSSLSSIFEVDGIRYVPVNPSARTCDAIDCTYDEYIDSINIGEKVTYRGIALSVKQVSPYTCYENKYIKDINLSFKGDIGAKAFYGCSNMITAELGYGILSIGESGFSSCSKLESIVIPDSVVAINDSTFCDCIVLNSAKIGRGVESIGRYAFSGCSVLPNIRIPQSVTSVAEYAFRGCENIKTVVMEDGNSELSLSSNGSNPLFGDCPLDSVYIGRNILYETSAEYGYSPFYHNETLRTVVITDKETEISDNEFYSCTNLQSFKIGDGVTRFGNWAFSGCSSLKTLGFGTELQSIGQEAFSDCSAVTVIVSRTEIPPVCESQALEDINKWECTLYVPEGTSPDYQEADQWKDFWYMEEGAPYVVIRGDVNGDEFVNMKDAMFVTNIILGIEDATEAADVNNDGKINIQDVMFIVNYIKNGTFPDE